MSQSFTDHYGMHISTQQAHAAQCWQEGLDRLLSQNAGPNTKFEEAIALDDGLALAHGGLAFWHMQRAQPAEARTSIARALACAAGITRRERQQLEIINLWIQGQGRQALTQLIAHLAEFPREALLMRLAHLLYNRGCSSVGEANFPVAYLGLLQKSAPYCDDNWAFLAEYAWAHHETGALDEAMRLAQRSLALHPSNAVAAHSVAHVYFERGDAGTGAEVLGDWLQGFDCPASSYVHLSWHLALFELALGQYHRALERYEHNMRPYVVAESLATLPDSASFLWRLQLYSGASASTVGTPPETSLAGQPWEEVRALATPMAERPGFAFQVAHAAFALAASDDQEGLTMMLTHLQHTASQGDLCTREMVVPLVQGIADFAQGQYARAAELLEPVCPQLVRIGGSHAQREVFEDTLLEAYLRAEQFDKAEAMLAERLARRASARDTFWLGRAQAGRGQHTQAQGSFATAAQSWRLGDTTSPEMTAFHDQYRQTTSEEAMAHHPQHQPGTGNSAEYRVTLERMNRFQEPEVRQAIADLQLPLGSYGLDVGCGVGLYALWLAAAVGPQGRVLGLEPQAERVAVAQRQVGDRRAAGRLEFRQGDATALPLPDQSCDWVWCSDVLHHIPDPVLALKEFMRVLRPGGRIIIKESQVAQALFLPGYPDLERQLQRAESAFHRHEAGARSFQERRQRTPESMQQAGLRTWHVRTYIVQRQAPLDAAARAYIQHTVFEHNWGPRLRGLLDSRDWQERTALCDATSPHYLLTRPEYYCLYPISVFSATTAATLMSIA